MWMTSEKQFAAALPSISPVPSGRVTETVFPGTPNPKYFWI